MADTNPSPPAHVPFLEKTVTDKVLLIVEILSVALTVLGITGKGPQLSSWVQHFKATRGGTTGTASQPPAPAGGATAPAQHNTIHSAPFQWGPADEAAMGLAMAQVYGDASKQAALDRLYGYIASTQLNQTQRDLLRGAVCAMDSAEREKFFINFAQASANKKKFKNFLKTQGIVRDPSPETEARHAAIVADNLRLDREFNRLQDEFHQPVPYWWTPITNIFKRRRP